MSKRTPEELLKSIAEPSIDEEIERVLAMTPEERREELHAAGFSEEELAAKVARGKVASEWLPQGEAQPSKPTSASSSSTSPSPSQSPSTSLSPSPSRSPSPSPVVLRPRRRRFFLLAAAATLTVGVPTGIFIARWFSPSAPAPSPAPSTPPTPSPSAPPTPPPLDVADLRQKAIDACKAMRWRECKEGLDLASTYDPAGDHDPLVELARNQATAGLAGDGDAAAENQNAKAPDDKLKK